MNTTLLNNLLRGNDLRRRDRSSNTCHDFLIPSLWATTLEIQRICYENVRLLHDISISSYRVDWRWIVLNLGTIVIIQFSSSLVIPFANPVYIIIQGFCVSYSLTRGWHNSNQSGVVRITAFFFIPYGELLRGPPAGGITAWIKHCPGALLTTH